MVQIMERNAVAALRNVKSQKVAFDALHISMARLQADSRDPMKMLMDISDAISRIKNASAKTAVADMIFGRDGSRYLSVLDRGYLRRSSAEAEQSGAVMSDHDIMQGMQAAEQWRELKLQVEGIKNETAAGIFPIMSELLGHASSWIREHRADISDVIGSTVKELKADLPTIERGMDNIAKSALEFSRELAPALHAIIEFSNSSFSKYMFSGQLVPGGPDLSDPAQAEHVRKTMGQNALDPAGIGHSIWDIVHAAAREGVNVASEMRQQVEVTVKAAPGTAVTSIRRSGGNASRGLVQAGG